MWVDERVAEMVAWWECQKADGLVVHWAAVMAAWWVHWQVVLRVARWVVG